MSTWDSLLSGRDEPELNKSECLCVCNIVLEIWIDLPGGAGLWLHDSSEFNRVIVIKSWEVLLLQSSTMVFLFFFFRDTGSDYFQIRTNFENLL